MIDIVLRNKGCTHENDVIWDTALPIGVAREQFKIMLKLIENEDAEFYFKASYGIESSNSRNNTSTVELSKDTVNSLEDIVLQIALNTDETNFDCMFINEEEWIVKHFNNENYYSDCTEEELKEAQNLYQEEADYYYSSDFDTDEIIRQKIKDDVQIYHVQKLKYFLPILRQLIEVEDYEAPFWSKQNILTVENEERFIRYLNNNLSENDKIQTESGKFSLYNSVFIDLERWMKISPEICDIIVKPYLDWIKDFGEVSPFEYSLIMANEKILESYKKLATNAEKYSIKLEINLRLYTFYLMQINGMYYERIIEFNKDAICDTLAHLQVKGDKIDSIRNSSHFELFKKINEIGAILDDIIDLSDKKWGVNPDKAIMRYNAMFN